MCVKLSFAGTIKKERIAPDLLYGEVTSTVASTRVALTAANLRRKLWKHVGIHGQRMLCARWIPQSMENIFIIPMTAPKQNTIAATPITVAYESTTGPVTDAGNK